MSSLIVEVVAIKDVQPIPGADRIQLAFVKGWQSVVQISDGYKVGDLVVFIPPDCILPPDLIEKYNITHLKNDAGRTRTVRLMKVLSEGLVLPAPVGAKEGDNVATIWNIKKWEPAEPPVTMRGGQQVSRKKLNPLFDKYTSIENAKNYSDVFELQEEVVITEKLHGTNFRVGHLPIVDVPGLPWWKRVQNWFNRVIRKKTHEVVFGSHNVQLVSDRSKTFYDSNVYAKIFKKYDFEKWLPEGFIVYGEIVGQGIQDLDYGLSEPDLFVFDIKFVDETGFAEYCDWGAVERFCELFGMKTVPVLYEGGFSELTVWKLRDGKSTLKPSQIREGCVVKPTLESKSSQVGRKILKYVSPDYLTRKNPTEFH